MLKVEVDTGAIRKAREMLKHYPDLLMDSLREGLLEIARHIHKTAVESLTESGAVDLGQLRNSIHIHKISAAEIIVGTNVEYAAAVEYGAKGHWLTIDKIPGFRAWMKSHGIDPEEDMKYFYVHPKPRPYMEPAYQAGAEETPEVIRKAVDEAVREIRSKL